MKPTDVLPDEKDTFTNDGVTIRKGSIAAFLANAKLLETTLSDQQHEQVIQDMLELMPALKMVGLFDVMTIRDPKLRELLIQRCPDSRQYLQN